MDMVLINTLGDQYFWSGKKRGRMLKGSQWSRKRIFNILMFPIINPLPLLYCKFQVYQIHPLCIDLTIWTIDIIINSRPVQICMLPHRPESGWAWPQFCNSSLICGQHTTSLMSGGRRRRIKVHVLTIHYDYTVQIVFYRLTTGSGSDKRWRHRPNFFRI